MKNDCVGGETRGAVPMAPPPFCSVTVTLPAISGASSFLAKKKKEKKKEKKKKKRHQQKLLKQQRYTHPFMSHISFSLHF